MGKDFINILFLLVGIVCGLILGGGLQYPLTVDDYNKASLICGSKGLKSLKIQLSGKVSQVQCKDDVIYHLS